MNWYKNFQSNMTDTTVPQEALGSNEDFISWLRSQPREKIDNLQNKIDDINKQYLEQFSHMPGFYHGTTRQIADSIRSGGFLLGEGLRSGFMGSIKKVNNQAIFLSDNKSLAYAYGLNRSDSPGDTDVIGVRVDVSNPLDMRQWNSSIPLSIRKVALGLLSEYEGTQKNRPTQEDMHWFLDQPTFVNAIKAEGYDAVIFNESSFTKKELGTKDGSTLAVFDPSKIHIVKKPLGTIAQIREAITGGQI